MRYIEIKDNLKDFIVFSVNDIFKIDRSFHRQRLSEWQKKGYIKKIAKRYYIFTDLKIDESVLFLIANTIYHPSYVSLEMALSYYGLIPEGVYLITSITSKKRYTAHSILAQFDYYQVKPELIFGYQLMVCKNQNFKIAEIEKAVLDYFYSNPKIKSKEEFEGMRINKEIFKEKVDIDKLNRYLTQFNNKSLEERINQLITYIND